jgi:hypothetical protein
MGRQKEGVLGRIENLRAKNYCHLICNFGILVFEITPMLIANTGTIGSSSNLGKLYPV